MLALFVLGCAGLAAAADSNWIGEYGGHLERNSAGEIVAVNLRASWIGDSDVRELARLPQLERLDLSFTRITDQGILYLKAARNLVEVNLTFDERVGDEGQAAIKELKRLKRLSLRGTRIADNTVAAAATLPELEALDISYTDALDYGLDALATAPKLKELSIGGLRITEVAFQSIRQIAGLEILDLGGGKFTGGGQRSGLILDDMVLQAIASLKELRQLEVGYAKFPSRGLAILKTLPKLERLNLENCSRIDDDAMAHLASWKSLRWVDLSGTKVTKEAVAKLRQQRPDCQVLWD
jgi:Leucine-rich repeat (LRR) protein